MKFAFWGPNIDKLAKNRDLPGMIKAWKDADARHREQIRVVLNRWAGRGIYDGFEDATVYAMIALGLLGDLIQRVEEDEFGAQRIGGLLPAMLEGTMAAGDVETVKWLLLNVRGWYREYDFNKRTLGAVVPFLRDHAQPSDIIEIVLQAHDDAAGNAAERALLQRGGPEAIEFYQQIAAQGFFGAAGVTIEDYLEARRDECMSGFELAYESDWPRIKSNYISTHKRWDQKRRKVAEVMASRLLKGPLTPKYVGCVRGPSETSCFTF